MTWGFVAVAGATVVGGYLASESQSDATGAITASNDKAADAQLAQFEQSRADQMPWLEAGKEALGTLQEQVAAGPGEFKEDPGYQFRLSEGNRNLIQNAAATSGTQSGATLKALQDYGQKSASNEYDRFLGRYYSSLQPLQSLAGVGQTTASGLGRESANTAGNLGNIYQSQGQAVGQGAISQSNVQTNAIQGLANTGAAYLGNKASTPSLPTYSGGQSRQPTNYDYLNY